jgi:hypothetical protein
MDTFNYSIKNPKSFKTITSAVKYLDGKYLREVWTNEYFLEIIVINSVRTTVSAGLRMDPSNGAEFKYFRSLEKKYQELFVRLS